MDIEKTNFENIHKTLREIRISKKMSQKKLGEKCGLAQQVINRIEQGKRKIDIRLLTKMCDALEIEIPDIMEIHSFSVQYEKESAFYRLISDMVKSDMDKLINDIIEKINNSEDVEVQDLKKNTHSISKETLEMLRQAQEGIIANAGIIAQQGKDILGAINKLNEEGQQKVKAYAEDLAENPKYQKDQTKE